MKEIENAYKHEFLNEKGIEGDLRIAKLTLWIPLQRKSNCSLCTYSLK